MSGVAAPRCSSASLERGEGYGRGVSHRPPRASVAVLLVVGPLMAGVAAPAEAATGDGITTADLLAGSLLVPDAPPVAVRASEVLALTPEMREFLATHVDRRGTGKVKLHNLVAAIIDSGVFGIQYDAVTRSAAETFRARRGNCLSFAGMFAALAREVGLDARFQEVEVPPAWTLDNDTFVLNRHVNVRVDLGREGSRVVDFNIADFRASYPMRVIADRRAMAHYGNNMAVERMSAGDTAGALAYLRAALANDPSFAPAWTNLGTLYQRHGHPAHAEAAYQQALSVARWDLVAMSNLAALYERLGDGDRAAEYHARVVAHRLRNPYYRYNLAHQALARGEVAAAIEHLTVAVRLRPSEDQFCFLLGVAYLRAGKQAQARKWFVEAERLAASTSLRFHYAAKIANLLGNGSPPPP